MAATYLDLAHVTLLNDANLADREVSDLLNKAPLLAVLAADTCDGITHTYVKETAAPVVGFREVNDGRENSKSADTRVTVELDILDASFDVDLALAKAFSKGPEAYVEREAVRHLRQAYFCAERQIINGSFAPGAADGYVGLRNVLVLAHAMTYNAGGTTANTGSSVYAIRSTGDMNDVTAISGKNGSLEISDSVIIQKAGATVGTYPAIYTPIMGWLGLQIGGAYSAARICNLTADAGKGLDDEKIAELLALFPSDAPPTHLVMSRRSRKQLQQSRTATNATGAPAPFPMEAFNIPILTTESIGNTEAILS